MTNVQTCQFFIHSVPEKWQTVYWRTPKGGMDEEADRCGKLFFKSNSSFRNEKRKEKFAHT